MDNEIVQEVLRRLDELGSIVAEGATAGFEILVRQQIITGILEMGWGLFGLFVGVVMTAYLLRSANDWKNNYLGQPTGKYQYIDDTYDWEDWAVSKIGHFIFALGTLITGSVLTTLGLKYLLNPQYYAIKELLDVIG